MDFEKRYCETCPYAPIVEDLRLRTESATNQNEWIAMSVEVSMIQDGRNKIDDARADAIQRPHTTLADLTVEGLIKDIPETTLPEGYGDLSRHEVLSRMAGCALRQCSSAISIGTPTTTAVSRRPTATTMGSAPVASMAMRHTTKEASVNKDYL